MAILQGPKRFPMDFPFARPKRDADLMVGRLKGVAAKVGLSVGILQLRLLLAHVVAQNSDDCDQGKGPHQTWARSFIQVCVPAWSRFGSPVSKGQGSGEGEAQEMTIHYCIQYTGLWKPERGAARSELL